MSYNYGTVGLASITSGTGQLVSATSESGSAVRVFDFALILTSATVAFYAGTSTVGGTIISLDRLNPFIHSDAGFRFIGGVYQIASATTGNLATINYIKEF